MAEDEPGAVVGDKGYDSGPFARFLAERGAEVVIPSRKNAKQPRQIDQNLYKAGEMFGELAPVEELYPSFDANPEISVGIGVMGNAYPVFGPRKRLLIRHGLVCHSRRNLNRHLLERHLRKHALQATNSGLDFYRIR